MAADVSLDQGVLKIIESSEADKVEVSYVSGDANSDQVQVEVAGQPTLVFDNSNSAISKLVFHGTAGNDQMTNSTGIAG